MRTPPVPPVRRRVPHDNCGKDHFVNSFESGGLKVEVEVTRSALRLSWQGRSTERDPSKVLKPFFGTLEPHIKNDRTVELDFRDLEFMNSSTVKIGRASCRESRESGGGEVRS